MAEVTEDGIEYKIEGLALNRNIDRLSRRIGR